MNKIFLTVDIECHDISKENLYIWGIKKEKEYGIGRILELGAQYNIPINFFLDFAEAKRYGRPFIQKIVDRIENYKQPIYLHLHPNYISGDENRTFLWEYNRNEQEELLKEGLKYYEDIMGKRPSAFRAGRYGVNKDSYDLIDKLIPGAVELSYTGGYGKMCHMEESYLNTVNHFVTFRSLKVIPNCSFIAFDLFGIRKTVGVDASEMSLTEFKEFIKEAAGRDFVLTMHSWNFINKFFWNPAYVGRNSTNERLFKGMLKLAYENGYEFTSIDDYDFATETVSEDIVYNSCNSFIKKIRSLFLNFWRFQQMAKISKKYMMLYGTLYIFLVLALIIFIYIRIGIRK